MMVQYYYFPARFPRQPPQPPAHSNSSAANSLLLKPPIFRNAAVHKNKMKTGEQPPIRLAQFQSHVANRSQCFSSIGPHPGRDSDRN